MTLIKMILNEIFYSIQGEGLNIGKPAVFVRFGNCNLKCRWCDTKYTWRGNKEVALGNVIKEIRKYKQCKHLVITGGEPMLQQKAILALRKAFPKYYIEVETNGSQPVCCFDAVDLFTVSYKTSNSGNAPYELKTRNEKCVYKFVVGGKADLPEIAVVIKKYKLPANKIFLMPRGVTRAAILKNQNFIVDYCKIKGYTFSTRLHILLGLK
ncbi:7-carboxy-7-deazaguanine synthase QueE [Candidatus Peregrinibacteria bacterium]|nr:7-carboxy-7-deazaguanine synthase QueE [Candidatus Peregrinibacteria bacterium]